MRRPPPRSLRSIALVLLLAASCGGSGEAGGIGVATGFNVVRYTPGHRQPMPRFAGPRLAEADAGRITQDHLRGAVSVVNFWGAWCGPCRREQRGLEALWRRYRERGVRFLGMNERDFNKAHALAYVDEFDVTYPSVYSPASEMAYAFRVLVMPQTFVIDRQGRIAARIIGAVQDERDLETLIEAELRR